MAAMFFHEVNFVVIVVNKAMIKAGDKCQIVDLKIELPALANLSARLMVKCIGRVLM